MLKKIVLIAAGLFLLIQLIRPGRQTPARDFAADFEQVAAPPAGVLQSLKKACYDCHSYETVYPWYANVAPLSWWVNQHITEGREHLNFSIFGKISPADRAEALEESAEALQEDEMPLPSYTWLGMHPEARLSPAEKADLLAWLTANGGEGNGSKGSGGATDDDD